MSTSTIPLSELQAQFLSVSDQLAAVDRQSTVFASEHKRLKKEKDRLAGLIATAKKHQPPVSSTSAWIEAKLGKSFLELNPNAKETRAKVYEPSHVEYQGGFGNVINPWEIGNFVDPANLSKGMVGPHDVPIADFWRDSANVALNRVGGLIRIQTDAMDREVHAISPRYDTSGGDPDPSLGIYGGQDSFVVGTARSHVSITNEALVLYDDGILGLAGTQTSRNWDAGERNFPQIQFPANLRPCGVALTTSNEFALVALHDTTTGKGKVAVIAMEAKYLSDQTWPWIGLLNQGSWSNMKLLGYVDLPFAEPDAIDAASNAFYAGPSATHDKKLSQIDLRDPATHAEIFQADSDGNLGMGALVGRGGYFIVSSKSTGGWAIFDLAKLFGYVRAFYGDGKGAFPSPLSAETLPELVLSGTMDKPTAVLAGRALDRWSSDRFKAYITQENGTLHIFDTSALMARWSWEKHGGLGEIGTMQVGLNPTCLTWARGQREVWVNGQSFFGGYTDGQGVFHAARSDGYGNDFIVVSRGTRKIQFVATNGGQGTIYREIEDSRLVDPVAAYINLREPVLTVCDYSGKIVQYRVGGIVERKFPYEWGKSGPVHGCGPEQKSDLECGGEMPVNGKPWAITSANVN